MDRTPLTPLVARDQEHAINSLTTWGDDAFIVDIWDAFDTHSEQPIKPEPQKWMYLQQKCSEGKVWTCRLWLIGEDNIRTRGAEGQLTKSIL